MSETENSPARPAEDARLKLRSDVTLLPLDDMFVAFSEDLQCLFSVNFSATLIIAKLKTGASVTELMHYLTSGAIAPTDTEQWLAQILNALTAYGLLGDAPPSDSIVPEPTDEAARHAAECLPLSDYQPAAEQHYQLLETTALIRFGHRAQVRLVNSVIGHMATEDKAPPSIVIDIPATKLDNGHLRGDVYRDGLPIRHAPKLSQLGPMVKATLWQSAINGHDFLFYIHAGVVGTGDTCVLLPAAAGSGKSSLTMALVHRGFRYLSDEVALIEPTTFTVPAMPLALCVKSTGWDLMTRYYPDIMSLPTHVRSDGEVLHYVPPPAGATEQRPMPVSHVIFPRYEAGAETRLEPVARTEALGRLMGECLALRQRLDATNVSELVRWIAGIECYQLTFSSLEAACDLVEAATGFKPPNPGGWSS